MRQKERSDGLRVEMHGMKARIEQVAVGQVQTGKATSRSIAQMKEEMKVMKDSAGQRVWELRLKHKPNANGD